MPNPFRFSRLRRLTPAYRLALPAGLALLVLLILPCAGWAKPRDASGSARKADAKTAAAAPSRADGSGKLDFTRVHQLYLNGDFDEAIAILENGLKQDREYTHDDSVFIYKHLGVMYAAQYETREKGKYYMHKLLAVEPTAKIMDMYASDMIYMIFKNIQEEYAQTRMQLAEKGRPERGTDAARADASPGATADGSRRTSSSRVEPAKPSGSRKWFWVGVSAATVAAGVGLYVALNHEPETKDDVEVDF